MTPILIFLSWASAETAIPSAAPATISPPSRRAALRTSIKASLENCALRLLFVDVHHMGSAGGCQAARSFGARLFGANPESRDPAVLLDSGFARRGAPPNDGGFKRGMSEAF